MAQALVKWTDEESNELIMYIEKLVEDNPDTNKPEIFSVACDFINERYGNERTLSAIRNHYYLYKKNQKAENTVEEDIITEHNIDVKDNMELSDIIEIAESLVDSYEKIVNENMKLKKELDEIRYDYDMVLGILNKARKLVIDEEYLGAPVKFKMEPNGNLVSSAR